jgi:formamidopyrimidine-DNA glycosylase
VRRTSRQAIIDGLTGATVVATRRRGKYLLLSLDTGDEVMVHLRMSGRVLISAPDEPRPAHTHVVVRFDGEPAAELRFVDPRTFGEVVVFDPANVAVEMPELSLLGVDPVAELLDRTTLRGLLLRRRRQMKALLLDQHVIAGIGNIYCDEILHAARIRHDRVSDTLTGHEITRLHRELHRILGEAIDSGGSTLDDTQYVDIEGTGGSFQHRHRVYARAGERCLTCGKADIQRVVVAGRSTHFCPRCQR